jgi:hypothetical protein
MFKYMHTSKKYWSLFFPVFAALILVMAAGCKKDDKVPAIAFQVKNYYPNSGQAGTLVTIEGEGFSTSLAQYKATVSGVEAELISATATALVMRMPAAGKSGGISISYREKNYEVGQYTYQSLTVSRVFPTNGPAGSQIRISGAGFSSIKDPASVLVNNKEALIVSASDTLIVAEIPAAAGTGPVMVKVDGMEAKGQDFRYQAVQDIKPLSGGAHTRVTINGEGFENTVEGNIVDFNGKPATVVTASATQLVVLAPEEVSTGPLSVNINGQKITGPAFTVVGKPVINIVSPLSGPKGVEMVITGDIFSTVPDENKVFINGIEVPVQSATANELKLTIPGGTGTGNIKVVVNDQATEGPQFKDQTLGIAALTPDNGLAGTTVTITGTGFSTVAAENTVYFNGVAAVVKTASETSLVLDAPAALSTGDVKVMVNGQEALAPMPFKRAGVITLAGGPSSNVFGSFVSALAIDSHGNIYVVDQANKVVKKVTPEGVVTVLQANGADIIFTTPTGIVIDKQDNIFVSDPGASQIRKITPAGQNIQYTSGFQPTHLSIDNAGNLYAGISGFGEGMNKVNTAGNYSKVNGPNWPMYRSAVDAAGNLYYPDQNGNGNMGLNITPPGGGSRNFVGGYYEGDHIDGVGRDARFNGVTSVVLSQPDVLLVPENYNYAIRRVQISTATVTTLVKFGRGYIDGTLTASRFATLTDIAVGKDGSIYILDAGNKAIRKIFLQ